VAERLYAQKLDLFRHLRELTTRLASLTQDQLVREERASEGLLELLAERERLMEEIDGLDAELAKMGAAGPQGALKEALLAEMLEIQHLDAELEKVLQSSMAHLRQEARKIQGGKQSQRAYFGGSSPEGAFIDKRR
jgi:hypothetical protein